MPRTQTDDVFSSSPAHPSHTRNPYAYAQTQLRRSLKRSAAVAALPSPPQSTTKRKAYNGPRTASLRSAATSQTRAAVILEEDEVAEDGSENEGDGRASSPTPGRVPSKPSELLRIKSGRTSSRSPELGLLAVQESAARSPSPFSGPPVTDDLPTVPAEGGKKEGVTRTVNVSGQSIDRPKTPTRDVQVVITTTPLQAPVTPPPTRKRGKRSAHPGPIRDSPNNPFLSTSPRYPRPTDLPPLEERDRIDFVFRGAKSSFPNPFKKRAIAPGDVDPSTLDPSHRDFSPESMVMKPRLLWPSSPTTPKTRSQTAAAAAPRSKPCRDPFSSSASASSSPSDEPLRHPSATDTVPAEPPVARRLFAEAHAHVHHAKTVEMKEGVKKGRMSGSMVIAQAHGPIRAGKETKASVGPPGLSRQPSHIPKSAKVKAAEALLTRKASGPSAASGVKTRSSSNKPGKG